ncbi:expansin-like B1 [Solanum dulcamara]|uniref:expansin-like B1 n=1 Tax=Solanum dulcamara TaxID=45834 RepID=UPI00248596DA|nr:expansin-like B1 [Solanum dulcamara]
MDFFLNHSTLLICLILILPALCYSQTFISKAGYYNTDDGMGNPKGVCGYEEYGRTVNNGEVCAVSRRLFKNGAGCGGCYQVRCRNKGFCSQEGVKVMPTDYGEGHGTDFTLSYRAFAKLAKQSSMAQVLFAKGTVDVEYRRISCRYGANLMLKIHERSTYPDYITLVVMNQGGASDILALEVYEEETSSRISMRRAYGAVWDLSNPPNGDLQVRFLISAAAQTKWVQSEIVVIPAEWTVGETIETDVQLS